MSYRRSILTKAAFTGSVSLIAIMSTPAAAQAVCVTTPLGVLDCAPDGPTAVVNLPGQVTPVTVTSPDTYTAVGTLLVDATGPVTVNADALISTVLDNQPALDLTSDANIFAQVNALSTQ